MIKQLSRNLLLQRCNLVHQLKLNGYATAASDPIQKLFVDKLREYNKKAASAPQGLVDADETVKTQLDEELARVRRNFNIEKGYETKLTSKFSDDDFQIDPINMNEWK